MVARSEISEETVGVRRPGVDPRTGHVFQLAGGYGFPDSRVRPSNTQLHLVGGSEVDHDGELSGYLRSIDWRDAFDRVGERVGDPVWVSVHNPKYDHHRQYQSHSELYRSIPNNVGSFCVIHDPILASCSPNARSASADVKVPGHGLEGDISVSSLAFKVAWSVGQVDAPGKIASVDIGSGSGWHRNATVARDRLNL